MSYKVLINLWMMVLMLVEKVNLFFKYEFIFGRINYFYFCDEIGLMLLI